ncbi:DNA-binding helix-turn-helix protein [Leptospira broomii serovar Hurstbridge str. 5399]|uniref:DNA-binding helix-turn-helix protein n=1 Tax=Leptospira broomii serovar Hurstbridge str. 5399 TaxID=1049789 RepID=T0FGW6_9LEPT|nr:metalloregulator ArsR/SmtB family transcription factor [Leptospira broomii]EQA47186.1 DNA-binding helix-turn-helix protein [Leptospira broomii serovar Hurstbridge str. 5399]
MSQSIRKGETARLHGYATLFAALGDETRLSIVAKLSKGQPRSISQLTEGSKLSRQAVTKHLKVLENAGIVQSTYSGRENLFELDLRPFKDIREYLGFVSEQWDQALSRLKSFVDN